MRLSLKTCTALSLVLALDAWGAAAHADTATAASASSIAIPDIVVTATHRSESANRIPVAIQALGGDTLAKLNVTKLDKLLEFLPNVRAASRGPGSTSIYIRGLSTDTVGLQVAGAVGAFPSVALYVNDAPISLIGRNVDLYAVDLQRVEVLAGPQGTLFGASSMGGAIRYITNKPDVTGFHMGVDGGYAFTKHGRNSFSGDGFVNIPIVKDHLAVRLVGYGDHQGGFIDNVPGTYQMPFDGNVGVAGALPTGNPLLVNRALASCEGVTNCTGSGYTAPTRQTITNAGQTGTGTNNATYTGFRADVLYKINEDWSADVMEVHQKLKTEGVFDYQPSVGDLDVQQFGPNSMQDTTDELTWTLNGRLSFLNVMYTGSYMNHKTVQTSDYSRYSNIGLYVPYYECDAGVYYTAEAKTKGNTCYSPNKSYQITDRTKRYTHELRVTTPGDKRIRGTLGVFHDVFKLEDDTNWLYAQPDAGFIYNRQPNPVSPNGVSTNPYDDSVRPTGTAFINDIQRRDRQFAVYGEGSFDIIPKTLTATGGFRYYNEQASINGSSQNSFCGAARGIYNAATGTYSAAATPTQYFCSGNRSNLNSALVGQSPKTFSGTLWKANVTWKFDPTKLAYFTFSQGYRPGGFNRSGCLTSCAANVELGYYDPDTVNNFEVGTKLSLFDHRVQFNAAAYIINWNNVQMTVFDENLSNQAFTNNFINAQIKGVEGDITYRATRELTLNGAFSYNSSKITKYLNNATTALEPLGSPLALSPKFQFNIRGRYQVEVNNGYRPYIQASYQHVSSELSSDFTNESIRWSGPTVVYNGVTVNKGDIVSPIPDAVRMPGYGLANMAVGVEKDMWSFEVYLDNVGDARPELFSSANDGVQRVTTTRPRTVGMRLSWKM